MAITRTPLYRSKEVGSALVLACIALFGVPIWLFTTSLERNTLPPIPALLNVSKCGPKRRCMRRSRSDGLLSPLFLYAPSCIRTQGHKLCCYTHTWYSLCRSRSMWRCFALQPRCSKISISMAVVSSFPHLYAEAGVQELCVSFFFNLLFLLFH